MDSNYVTNSLPPANDLNTGFEESGSSIMMDDTYDYSPDIAQRSPHQRRLSYSDDGNNEKPKLLHNPTRKSEF
jgi:hypothetical protein